MKWSVTRTIFPFQPIFSRNILPISKIFLVSKSSSITLSDLTIFNFRKSVNFEPLFPLSHFSANRNLENKIENVIQHIKKPISVKKFRRIKGWHLICPQMEPELNMSTNLGNLVDILRPVLEKLYEMHCFWRWNSELMAFQPFFERNHNLNYKNYLFGTISNRK